MRKKSVAVLDIRSSEMTAAVGERGVNNTFIIKSKYSAKYEGFAEGELLDEQSFYNAASDVIKSTLTAMGGVREFFVGVPGEFLKLEVVDKVISFNTAKKINAKDLRALEEMSVPPADKNYPVIRRSCLYYVLSDKRKVINPLGAVSDSLQGKFCFYKCDDKFIQIIKRLFRQFPDVEDINLIPSNHANCMYLVEPEKRDECAVLFDLGYISSTYCVVCGNGLLYSESFSLGIGHIAAFLMGELDIPFDVASSFLSAVNLNAKETLTSLEECMYEGKIYGFSTMLLRDKIREGLDGICETIEECRQNFTDRNLEGKPLLLTGEGVKVIRGTAEHISNRLVKTVEIASPRVPYYDKPQFGSLFSLLDIALNDILQ